MELKGETTDEVYQERRFPWKRGASSGEVFYLLNFRDLLHAQEPI